MNQTVPAVSFRSPPPRMQWLVPIVISATLLVTQGSQLSAQPPAKAPIAKAPSERAPSEKTPPIKPLADQLRRIVREHRGDISVSVRHLKSGESFEYQADKAMPTASLIKVAVMIEAYRQVEAGKLSLDQRLVMRAEDRAPGSGILTKFFSPGLGLSLSDAMGLMISHSDNTATNLVIDQVGIKSVADTMVRHGFPNTKLHAKVYRRDSSVFPSRSREFGLGSSTAAEMASILEKLLNGHFGADSTEAMLDHLYQCQDTSKLARHLPDGLPFAHKTGAVSKIRTDAGILQCSTGPVVICVFTANNTDQRWTEDNAAERLMADVGRRVAQHFHLPTAKPAAVELRVGATGAVVEDLQRTLNERLKPSPKLAIDGDFGPATEAAVRQFQQSRKTTLTGIVDAAMWKALGPIVPPVPVAPPDEVNSERLKIAPADVIEGRPFVSCKSWAIANAKTGEVLWHHDGNKPRDNASTTKIMTAWMVLELIKDDEAALNETIVFSARADNTPGSTAGVRAGERVSVQELLYGLMLPSGNDASVALAEHFGERAIAKWKPVAPLASGSDTLAQFVAAMNAAAVSLDMHQTSWRNPHGLTAAGHRTSPIDLIKLTMAARKHERFRTITTTRQHGCTVIGATGYQRNVIWRNTNRLLRQKGYHGVKTGTTSAAGACLVSVGSRDDRQLMLVVLGASGSDARYADSRNLYRWAWQQP